MLRRRVDLKMKNRHTLAQALSVEARASVFEGEAASLAADSPIITEVIMSFVVLHSTSAALLAAERPHLTVEAEYGTTVVEGSIYTAAHHQPTGEYAGDHVVAGGRPSPCVDKKIPVLDPAEGGWIVGISHVDLDTIGGALRALPAAADIFAPAHDGFWGLAAYLDVNGAHKMAMAGASKDDIERIYGWMAHSKSISRLPLNVVTDATEVVLGCLPVLRALLADDAELLQAGRDFRDKTQELNEDSFQYMTDDGVIVRAAPGERDFVNLLYTAPDGSLGVAVVAHNKHVGTITVSLESPISGVSCRDVVQGLWGDLAGGHPGIAGSPRGRVMTEDDVGDCVEAIEAAIRRATA